VFVPVDLDGARGKVVFEVAHRRRDEVLYWHLDEEYQGETRFLHQMALAPSPGQHLMTVVDARGNSQTVAFEVLEEKKRRTSP
jgi:penicillin-binding protein 1C